MSYHVQITDTAKQDLREIAFYIAEQSQDKEIARSFVSALRAQCMRLAEFPQSGALPRDHVLRSLEYRYLVYKEYLIFYLIDKPKKTVSVHAFFNSRKDYLRVMKRFI